MRASAFRSTCQAACCRPRAVQPARISRAARQQQQRGYASEQQQQQQQAPKESREMNTPNKSDNFPLLIGAACLIAGATTYTISRGQAGVKHNDHAAQAGGEYTQGREQRGSAAAGGQDASKEDLPGDAPNKPENLAVSEEKMQGKAPSKRTDPQA